MVRITYLFTLDTFCPETLEGVLDDLVLCWDGSGGRSLDRGRCWGGLGGGGGLCRGEALVTGHWLLTIAGGGHRRRLEPSPPSGA